MVMVDEFLGLNDGVSSTALEVRGDNIFCDGGYMSECGVIEHIAQSAAARAGFVCRSEGREVPVGFIGAVNNFEISRLPRVGERLVTGLELIQQVYSVSLVRGVTRIGDETVASCKMKIFIQDNESKA